MSENQCMTVLLPFYSIACADQFIARSRDAQLISWLDNNRTEQLVTCHSHSVFSSNGMYHFDWPNKASASFALGSYLWVFPSTYLYPFTPPPLLFPSICIFYLPPRTFHPTLLSISDSNIDHPLSTLPVPHSFLFYSLSQPLSLPSLTIPLLSKFTNYQTI